MCDELEMEAEESAVVGLTRDEVLALKAKPRVVWYGPGAVVGAVGALPKTRPVARLDTLRAVHRSRVAGGDPMLESPATRDLRAVMVG